MNDRGLREFGADTTGFGAIELKTLWHSLRRPVAVLDAYMTEGPTGGGRYARPLRLYLTLCGVLMIVQFLMGGMDAMLAGALPPEAIDRVYEAFFSTKAEGMGIGLNLCRSIIESHEGRIAAENLYNADEVAGCRFSFWLPVTGTVPTDNTSGAAE